MLISLDLDFPILIRKIDDILSKFVKGQGLVCLILSMVYIEIF